jgi:hypothetical protein
LIHCASLVHDDLPCFDDADMRRGKPTVHRAYSEPLAVLAGDSLIVLAFDLLARAATDPARALGLVRMLAARTGMPHGICAGQGWESEQQVDLRAYHRAKTGALFIAATQMGARPPGRTPSPGPNWAPASARRSRWPTTCATRCMTPKRWASRWGRTRSMPAPRRWPNWACRARSAHLRTSCRGHRLDPVLPGRGDAGRHGAPLCRTHDPCREVHGPEPWLTCPTVPALPRARRRGDGCTPGRVAPVPVLGRACPGLRRIARAEGAALFDMMQGFVQSRC